MILLTESNNQFHKSFDQVLQAWFVYFRLFFGQKHSDCLQNSETNTGFVVSELVFGSGEQDTTQQLMRFISCHLNILQPSEPICCFSYMDQSKCPVVYQALETKPNVRTSQQPISDYYFYSKGWKLAFWVLQTVICISIFWTILSFNQKLFKARSKPANFLKDIGKFRI